jgi:hypothetical protein
MDRVALVFVVGVAIGIGIARLTLAHAKETASKNGEHVKVLASYDLKEKLDGKGAAVTMVEVSFEPRGAGTSHRHPGREIGKRRTCDGQQARKRAADLLSLAEIRWNGSGQMVTDWC